MKDTSTLLDKYKELNVNIYSRDDVVKLINWANQAYDMLTAQQVAVPVPLSGYEITKWWAAETDLEDCNMYVRGDFERVVRAIEARHGITQGEAS